MEKEKILIFGNGQMGKTYQKHFGEKVQQVEIAECDITKKDQLEEKIKEFNPTTVINVAAKTNLEWCSKNKLETFEVNVLGADNIAQLCNDLGIYFIHFSSGCIFESKDENDAKAETDIPSPGSYYAWTKVWAEQMIQFEKSSDFKYLILRPRQPVSAQVNYKNMLMKMLTFSKFIDTPNSGTVIEDLMEWTETFIKEKPVGILHVANKGFITPYEIGLMLKEHILPNLEVNKITKEELDSITPNKRVDTTLNVDKLENMGIQINSYKERLGEIIKQLAQNIKDCDKEVLKEELDKTMAQSKARTVTNECWRELLQ